MSRIQQILAFILGVAVMAGIIALTMLGLGAENMYQEPGPAPTTTQEYVYYHEA